ncbi:MAG TPA: FAD/NAD(P)-binding protein [Rhodopila sp.]|nr:FAD/NAD(P)-binding protein [Rhodopila sp.]
MTTIAIIGAGFSGTLLSLHLLRRCPPPAKLILIERNAQFGLGVAYATGNPSHILNVPAARMSAFHDQPDHFLNWLSTQPETDAGPPNFGPHNFGPPNFGPHNFGPPSFGPHSFVPRQMFGAYIRALLNEEIKRCGRDRLELVRGAVTAVDRRPHKLTLTLDRDRTIEADFAVLATGNFPPEPVPVANPGFYDTPFYRPDPWATDAITGLDPDAPALLLGTGLTMVDAAISLLDQGHRGPIQALSRRGLIPRRHEAVPMHVREHAPFPTSVNALTRFLRREAQRATAQGGGWQPIIDELRPFTVDVWQTMTLGDRARFLRHLRPWWDVHRHRTATAVADRIDAACASGQLRIIPGRVRDYTIRTSRVEVTYKPRGQDRLDRIEAARVINCAGPGADYDRISDPLIRSLLRDGVVRPDPLRLGLDVTANCALLNQDGAMSRRLFAVGPVTKGAFWEITAVPDIRRQTEKLADYLAPLVKAALVGRA